MTKRLTKKQSIEQGKNDIRGWLMAYKKGDCTAEWARQEVDRIAAFYAHNSVDAYAAAAKGQISRREAIRPVPATLIVALAFLLLPIFATGQVNTYRQAMGMPQAPPPVEIVKRWKPVQPVAILLPRKVRCRMAFNSRKKSITMSNFSITGRIIRITGPEQKSPTFTVAEVVIETEDRYPQTIPFQMVNDRADRVVNFAIGDMVEIFFDVRGRKWEEKYYPQLNAWKIEAIGANAAPPAPAPNVAQDVKQEAASVPAEGGNIGEDDLPF